MLAFILGACVSSSIEAAKLGWVMGKGQHWEPGEKLKLLFAGYNGTRNMGSDVRASEMRRQMRHILGAARVEFSVMTQTFQRKSAAFERSKQVHLTHSVPLFLVLEVRTHCGVEPCG